ncbi:MAG: GAP family protein [Chloroflexi bacterium]|nr:GAP family protein [Chloroflexota bacterium]
MGPVFGDLLPIAVGVAISPLPVIAIILMLITPRARSNGIAFLVGWAGAIAIVTIVGGVVLGAADTAAGSSATTWSSLLRVALGILLLILAARDWRQRPRHGETAELPAWMSALDRTTPARSLGMAALLGGVNPKNLLLNIAAATTIAAAGLTTAENAVVVAIYVVIASVSIAAPLGVYLAMGARAQQVLGGWKEWLTQHNQAVMAAVFLVLGAVVLGEGVAGLL